jgi:hypothetical protein
VAARSLSGRGTAHFVLSPTQERGVAQQLDLDYLAVFLGHAANLFNCSFHF